MTTGRLLLVSTVMGALALGCSGRDDPPGEDAGGRDGGGDPVDSGPGMDTGPGVDAGPIDAGPGERDAGPPDAGPTPDAGVRECDLTPCFRAFECAAACGEEPFYVGCCACPEGSVDLPVDCRPDAGSGDLPAGARCGGDLGTCGPGLSCCYPCGIPGCDNICEPTCAEGEPGCFGGCFLRP